MNRPSLAFVTLASLSFFPASCGSSVDTDSGQSGQPGGYLSSTGSLTLTSNRPTKGSSTGASFSLSASFTSTPTRCTTTTVGACTVNPCYEPSTPSDANVPLPSAGQVSLVAQGVVPFSMEPQSDGSYASESVLGVPWTTGGQSVTVKWAHFPGDAAQAGDEITLQTPPYVALTKGSAFDVVTNTLSRDQDLTVSWTSDSPPAATDDLVVAVNGVSTQVYCTFSAGAGTGVVPAAALASLQTGQANYNVHSKRTASENKTATNGATWNLGFNVDAEARSSYGLANGSVTIQ